MHIRRDILHIPRQFPAQVLALSFGGINIPDKQTEHIFEIRVPELFQGKSPEQ